MSNDPKIEIKESGEFRYVPHVLVPSLRASIQILPPGYGNSDESIALSRQEALHNARLLLTGNDLLAALRRIANINGSTGGAKALVNEFRHQAQTALGKFEEAFDVRVYP